MSLNLLEPKNPTLTFLQNTNSPSFVPSCSQKDRFSEVIHKLAMARWLSFLLKTQDRNNNPQQDSQLCLQGQAQPCTDSVYFSAFVFSILPLNRTWMSLKICFWRNAKYWQSLPSALEAGPVFHYLCSRKPCVSSGLSLSNFSFSLAFLTMLFSKVEDSAINMVPMSRSLRKNNHVISQSSTQEAGFQVKTKISNVEAV